MKKNLLVILLIFSFSVITFSQTPQQFKYQAVLRDADGNILANQNKTVVIDILKTSPTGTSVFTESHSVTTSAQGLINLNIGSINSLDAIDWGTDEYFFQIKVDGIIMGTSQVLSVAYALLSKEVENVDYSQITNTPDLSDFVVSESDPAFTSWDKTSGISITQSQISDLGSYIETETQNLDDVLTQGTSAGSKNITELANPVNPQDAATKAYVDFLRTRIFDLEGQVYGVTDVEGNFYKGVKIGDQIWLAENLRTTKYNDGTPIPNVTVNADWVALTTPAYCWYNNDETTYKAKNYGALYNWFVVDPVHGRNVCPAGWHVPNDDDFNTLIDYLEGDLVAGGKMKKEGNSWAIPNTGATNESGFSALPSGFRFQSGGGFLDDLFETTYWGTFSDETMAHIIILEYDNDNCILQWAFKPSGRSVRCIKD